MRKKRSSKKARRSWYRPIYGKAAVLLLVVTLVSCVYFFHDLPDVDKVKPLDIRPSIVILANDGTQIARYGGMKGDILGVKDLPKTMVEAVLAVEDRRFYSHFGVDPIGLARAMFTNVRARHWVQGGSTITQQLAKNVFLTSDKTIRRKVQEALIAFIIENRFTKDEILTAYLNRVYFGAGAYGIDAAAKTYFNKSATDLTLWEGAVLAGLLKAPSRFSPASNPELAQRRADVVIQAMKDAGYLDKRITSERIAKTPPTAVPKMAGDLNRYFADWVLDQIDSFISTTGGEIIVKTTLDPRLQVLAEEKQKAIFAKIKPEDRVTQMALVTEGHDGAILAMLGGVNYKGSQFNRATQATRQPGSAFKPFVFLAALENGYAPDSKILDAPIKSGDYRPDNYEGKYFGEVDLTYALAKSMNTATIRLLDDVGVDKLIDVAARMGFTEDIPAELSAALGTTEVNLLELTNAYATIANGGRSVFPYAVLSVKDGHGMILYQHADIDYPEVFSEDHIAALDSMLEQVVAQGTGTAAQLSRGHVAGKTGTTQNYRDALFLGYTDNLTTGVWMGNDDNTPMERVTGGKYPAQLWRDYMSEAIKVDVPKFVPEAGPDDGFGGMINRWSRFSSDDKPAYNN